MISEQTIERRVLIFALWMTLGTIGLCLVLQGLADDNFGFGIAGSATLAAGFIGHLIINSVFETAFTQGEMAFGTGFVTLTALLVVMGWARGNYSIADQQIAAVLMSVLLLGVLTYLVVKYGVRGVFSRFHSRHSAEEEDV